MVPKEWYIGYGKQEKHMNKIFLNGYVGYGVLVADFAIPYIYQYVI